MNQGLLQPRDLPTLLLHPFMAAIQEAKILFQKSHIVPGKLRVTEHFFEVPRDYASPAAGTLKLFARSATKVDKPADGSSSSSVDSSSTSSGVHEENGDAATSKSKSSLPWMLFLQGGPGFECRPPQHHSITHPVLDRGYQVLFLDQRGTGLSSAISASTLATQGDDDAQAKYLKAFRADSIVRDCEAIRKALMRDEPEEKRKWSIMGQSFGGFCATTYLSFFPSSLREVFMFGGLPPLAKSAAEVYDRTYKRVEARNEAYYTKYPEDVERIDRILDWLHKEAVALPSGGKLSPERFQQLGLMFGGQGGIDALHDIVLRATFELDDFGHFTRRLLANIEQSQSFEENPLYAILHEQIYCDGDTSSEWAAQSVRPKHFDWSPDATAASSSSKKVLLTGEMVYPWMFNLRYDPQPKNSTASISDGAHLIDERFPTYPELSKLSGPAHLLAFDKDWPKLYDLEQLEKRNEVPVYAAVYMDDMYVDFDLSLATARMIKGCKIAVTNAMYHDALRAQTSEVLGRLWALRDDTMD